MLTANLHIDHVFRRLHMRALMLKLLRSVCNFRTEICDSSKNYVHHGEERPALGGLDMVILM